MVFEMQVFDVVKGKESKRTLEFVKYHGIGNDFIMVRIFWGFCSILQNLFLGFIGV